MPPLLHVIVAVVGSRICSGNMLLAAQTVKCDTNIRLCWPLETNQQLKKKATHNEQQLLRVLLQQLLLAYFFYDRIIKIY